MVPRFELQCGIKEYATNFKLTLSLVQRRLGVLVSGGLDSALLYYLIRLLADERYTVIPFVIDKNDKAKEYAPLVVEYVNKVLNKPVQDITYVTIQEKNPELEVSAGTQEIEKTKLANKIYTGLIQTLPEHALNVSKPTIPGESLIRTYPMRNLNKSHIVDLIYKLNLEELFKITHSCVYNVQTRCGSCNRCNERRWAFDQLNKTDPGIF